MTILTKPSNEKKAEKVPLPLALGGHEDAASFRGGVAHGTLLGRASYPADNDAESMVFNRPPSCTKTVILFLMAVTVMMMGLIGGYSLYRAFPPTSSNLHYRALCDIPYMQTGNISVPRLYEQNDELDWRNLFSRFTNYNNDYLGDDFFREEIEMDMSDNESYAKIDVPDFKDGRRGRFMHDFKENQSAIIDTTTRRCFIMPLDRETTLPPKSFIDLMQKMSSGYYNIDAERVRRKMRVVTPPVTDLTMISERIANECYDMKVYMLENYVSGVFKREAKPVADSGKFAEFMGKGVVEFDLINIADIEEFEKKQQ